jgi:hypothetical protein
MSMKTGVEKERTAGEHTGRRWVERRVIDNAQDGEMMERLNKFADFRRGRRIGRAPYGASERLYFIMSGTDSEGDRDRKAAREFWEWMSTMCPYETHSERCPSAAFVEGFIAGAWAAWKEAKQAV